MVRRKNGIADGGGISLENGSVRPGAWYADPYGADGERWWDGGRWTDEVRQRQAVQASHPPIVGRVAPAPGDPVTDEHMYSPQDANTVTLKLGGQTASSFDVRTEVSDPLAGTRDETTFAQNAPLSAGGGGPTTSSNGIDGRGAQVFCTECGTALRGAKFCPHCGIATSNGLVEHAPAEQAEDEEPVNVPPTVEQAAFRNDGEGQSAAEEQNDKGWFARRRKWVFSVVAALLVVGLVAVALFVVLKPSSTAPQRTHQVLHASDAAVESLLSQASQASLVSDLRTVASQAQSEEPRLSELVGEASAISVPRYRKAATVTLRAEQGVVNHLAQLSTLGDNRLLRKWTPIHDGLVSDENSLTSASAAVASLHLKSGRTLVPSPSSLTQLTDQLDAQITKAATALGAWQRSLTQAKASQASALKALTAYAGTMRGYTSQYNSLRSALTNDVQQIDSGGVTWTKAYQMMSDAISARQSLKTSISQLSAPSGLAPAENQIAHVIDESINAVGDADSGLSDYQFSFPGQYSTYTATPGWQQFESMSSQITSDFSSADANWESQVQSQVSAIRNRAMPQGPTV
jgi:hypothetical protein